MVKFRSMTSTYPMWRISLLVMLGLLLLGTAAYGQGTASLVGTVIDPTGLPVPNAKITVTDTDTGIVRLTSTNAVGSYAAHELPIGQYRSEEHTSELQSPCN